MPTAKDPARTSRQAAWSASAALWTTAERSPPQHHDRHGALNLVTGLTPGDRQGDQRQGGCERGHQDRVQPLQRAPLDRLLQWDILSQQVVVVTVHVLAY